MDTLYVCFRCGGIALRPYPGRFLIRCSPMHKERQEEIRGQRAGQTERSLDMLTDDRAKVPGGLIKGTPLQCHGSFLLVTDATAFMPHGEILNVRKHIASQ